MGFTHTIACEDRDFPEWHGGRTHALVWALLLDDADTRLCIDDARRRLGGLVLPRYERQPHVSVAFAGLAEEPGLPGYGQDELAADLERIRPLLEGPVEMRAARWGSFPMVPYLGVQADWLHRARAALDRQAVEVHEMPYVPHVTVGHWRGRWSRETVMGRLGQSPPVRSWQVRELSLLRYESVDIAGPLETVGSLDLTNGHWSSATG